MRGMRNALWALGLAGAAYAWKNRNKLQQQTGNFGRQPSPNQLPDYRSQSGGDTQSYNHDTANERQGESISIKPGTTFGGTDI